MHFQVFTADATAEIRAVLEQFGDVESIEILQRESTFMIQRKKGFKRRKAAIMYSAYVQFKQSEDAYKAINSPISLKNLVRLLPADTWHQPEYKECIEKPNAYYKCNHICNKSAEELTCTLDELLVCESEELCEHAIDYHLELLPGTTLNMVRRNLRCIKPYIGHLRVTLFEGFENESPEDCVQKYNFQRRLMEIIGMNAAGPKLHEMTITGITGITKIMLDFLAPALKPLTALTIKTGHCNILYFVQHFCPKLTSFHFIGSTWEGDVKDVRIHSWPTLNRLALRCAPFKTKSDSDDGKRIRLLMTSNPQIETLEMDFEIDNSLLNVISKGIHNLRSLTINRKSFDNNPSIFKSLIRLKRLESFMVTTWIFKTCHFKSLVGCVECFSNNKRLKIATMVQTYVRGGVKTIDLDEFPVIYHQNCICHGPDHRLLTFAGHTDAIILPKHKRTLALLILVARDLKTTDNTLEARIFTMFKGTKNFYPDVHKTTIIEEDDRFVFLHVASTL